MNLDLASLPSRCDVLVVGAGPAGSAAALTLARAGLDVVLIDRHAFPRDKVCGDGLIPDAHQALRQLGVLDAVMARARTASHVGCVGPRGGRIDVPGTLAVLPRRELDDILCRAAVAAGVKMFAPLRFVATLEDGAGEGARVIGARLQQGEATRALHCRWLVLASGASAPALAAAGMLTRQSPSGVALRGYLQHPAACAGRHSLDVVWHRDISPGYGWIFPGPGGIFNIGVGLVDCAADANLRQVFDDFIRVYPPARELIDGGEWLAPLKGAPLRCTLEGARHARAGLLVTGEAAGSTYSFTGEGIGKALATGIRAGTALAQGWQPADDATVCAGYENALRAFKPRFDLYAKANRVNRHPWLADLLIWRARRSPRLLQRMSGVLEETSNPGHLLTLKGLTRLFLE